MSKKIDVISGPKLKQVAIVYYLKFIVKILWTQYYSKKYLSKNDMMEIEILCS